jgi:hypothetical protein
LESNIDNPVIRNVIVNSFINTSSNADFLISISSEDRNQYETQLFYLENESTIYFGSSKEHGQKSINTLKC